MRSTKLNASLIQSALAASLLLVANSFALAQSTVTLTAAPTSTTLPDGQTVPMWGYACSAVSGAGVSCTAANGEPQTGGWQPPLITVPSGSDLTITLNNNLTFATPDTPNNIPTSLVIVGLLGGGLGDAPQRMPSPVHAPQGTTWPGTPGGTGPDDPVFTPPAQEDRVRSFATEVDAGSSAALVWTAANLRPGTYLIESGTQPSIQGAMGLYGVLVVTDAAYPGQTFDDDVALLLSEIDPVQNREVDQVVRNADFSETAAWSGQVGACGDLTQPAAAHSCYPPTVNYDPRYFLINGVSFDRSDTAASALTVGASATQGRVLLRFVNAGLRMHVPSVVGGNMTLLAEDGNILPGTPKVQSALFLAAGKTSDVTIQPTQTGGGTYNAATYAVFDRALGLSTNNQRDGGMQAFINVAGGAPGPAFSADANPDSYSVVAGNTLTVSDVARGLIANDVGIYGVSVPGATPAGLTLNSNGTFTYSGTPTSFTYCGNGATSGDACALVTLNACTGACLGGPPLAANDTYTSSVASRLQINPPGVLGNDRDPSSLPLNAVLIPGGTCAAGIVDLQPNGSFTATPAAPGSCTFTYNAVNSQNTATAATVTLNFPDPSNLQVTVRDADDGTQLDDYRWIIEEDRTVFIDPASETTTDPAPVRNLALNFHTSHSPLVATGCTGPISCESGQTRQGVPVVCDVGNGDCRLGDQKTAVNPDQVVLDPAKRYYISVLPGDAANDPEESSAHTMGGAQIAAGQTAVDVSVRPLPFRPAQISVFVYDDDFPLNGEYDTGGGVDTLSPNEAGLGSFSIVLMDKTGMFGDAAGQLTYDEFAMPVSNSLAGKIDPLTGLDACPISPSSSDGLVGMIVTCPYFESDGVTPSPLAGQALIANMYPGLYEVHATPAADRIARGEEWLQTFSLDGTRDIEAFIMPDEPAYFQEFGPGGYHVAIGFANPAKINARRPSICAGAESGCDATLNGQVTNLRISRTPDQRVYSSGSYEASSYTNCYVSVGYPDSADFAFTKCNADGTFSFNAAEGNGVPEGNLKVTVFDQYNDLLVDGLSTPVRTAPLNVDGTDNANCNPAGECFYEIAVTQWRANLYGRIFLDQNNDGVSQDDEEPGLPLVPYNIRYRDGSYMGFNNTDLAGFAGFNEVFPFVHWLVVDTDSARYKQTGVHVVYDAGGAVDGTPGGGTSTVAAALANTIESPTAHVPASQRIPGARYCANADCTGTGSFNPASGNPGSTGRVDPGWVPAEAWQGLLGQASFINFALSPFAPGENGGIKGHVVYTSTRPFDDPALLFHLQWEPLVPNVTVNLYREGIGPDGTKSLQFVDTTQSTSWDDWAQGFRSDGMPNMSCPGLEQTSPFYFTMENSTQWLNPTTPLPANSRFKCHDGWAMLNQVQPAPYNGMYKFPSVTARDPVTGMPTATNCTGCIPNPAPVGDPDRDTPMLPPGKYVVEIVIPPGYELVKEEDKNILLGDLYIAPVTTQFAGFGNIFILPDQAAINAYYNPYNPLQSTTNNGASPRAEGDTGSIEVYWPCVGATRIVPDFNSLFPGAGQAAPFAGASRPLCDRKEVVLTDAMTVLAKFYVFTSAHISSSFSGLSTNDFAGEFDPFSPQFGEKAAVANIPVAIKDFTGKEISRVYGDQWGRFNGKNYSSWTINPPSPSGFIPQMMIVCMNDPGPILDTRPGSPTLGQMITDPFYNPAYSDFCYEQPFMPGQTQYLDTPVVPTMAFAAQYNLPDCEYPDTTPAIKSVNASGTGQGPWVDQPGRSLTITALGDKQVLNHAYSGPQADTSPFNQKFITRHYGFGEQCITPNGSATCNTVSSVTIGGVNAPITAWTDSQITVTVPALTSAQSNCPLAQRTTPAAIGSSARCGQVVITAGNGKQSIDAITVTIAGKPPTYVAGPNAANNALQTAIDNAVPGDLIIVGPGTYKELLLMWKPVRLQGVGAESVIINADAHPAGKLDPWRRQVNCLFGLTLEGQPANAPYAGCPATMLGRVDRAPGEPIIGWNASLNGNLAEQLVEPTLMGAYEGAGITVLGRGFRFPVGGDRFNVGAADEDQALPDGATYLTSSNADCNRAANPPLHRDFATSNFLCNPSRIDGITITNGSQGGGGIFAHAWNHFLEISNNRTYANHGTLSGGVVIGIGEFGAPYIVGGADPIPFAVPPGLANGTQLGRGLNRNVRVHHNAVTSNASLGDSLYSGTFSAAGGVSFCTGSDNYLFNYNWICGNVSSGDAGGVAHVGFTNDGRIERNWILFNQSASPTIPVHGGGLAILGASPDRTLPNGDECGTTNDLDCPPGLPEGTGRNLVIDANLILGNSAQSGTGGGLRLQGINGEDVIAFPTRPNPITTGPIANRSPGWNSVTVINNIIANNVAGWDGGGVSMQDALKVSFVNNTVISNDTTASAGVLFNTLGAPNASVPPPGCTPQPDPTQPQDPSCINPVIESTYQPAGLVTMAHTPNLIAALGPDNPGTQVVCPAGFGYGAGAALNDGSCREVSLPLLSNDLFWQNRAFRIEVGALGGGQQNQQAVVTLVPSLNQGPVPPGGTGFCDLLGEDNGAPESGNPVNYWDIGVRGDVTPTPDSGSGFALNPMFSILTETAGYTGAGLLEADPEVVAQYCNGSRLPPEGGGTFAGFNAPPGRSETTGLYPVFALNQITPAATVDEGNNWIDLNYGPLSLANAATAPPTGTAQDPLGNYDITAASPAITAATPTGAPDHDFFGRSRPLGAGFDIGAVEFFAPPPPLPSLPVLDNFNRANANNLNIGFAPGTNWSLPTPLLGGTLRALRVVNNAAEAFLLPLLTNWAVWNGPGNVFGANQGAAFTFVNAPVNGIGSWLVLKASGGSASTPANYIRVRYLPAGQVEIATTNNGNTLLPNYTVRATLSATFASGDRLTALAGPTGTVSVWRTTAANVTTFVGSVPIPTTGAGAWTQGTGGGRVGLLLPIGARVDDFAGGTVP